MRRRATCQVTATELEKKRKYRFIFSDGWHIPLIFSMYSNKLFHWFCSCTIVQTFFQHDDKRVDSIRIKLYAMD